MMSSGLSQLGLSKYKCTTGSLCHKLAVWSLNDVGSYQVKIWISVSAASLLTIIFVICLL